MSQIIVITLENEMDIMLSNKRCMRLGEILNLTLSTRTTFTAAVSEICREVVELNNTGVLTLGIEEEGGKFHLTALVKYDLIEGMDIQEEGLVYAKRLVSNIRKEVLEDGTCRVILQLSLPRTLKLDRGRVAEIKKIFEFEEPINSYEEIKRKNYLLNEMALQTERELRESKYLNDKKNEFLSIASHELKTPITTIKAYTQLAVRAQDDCSVPVRRYLNKIDMQVNKLQSLIQQLLDVTKIEAGKLDVKIEKVYVNAYIHEVVEMIRQITPGNTIKLELDFDAIAHLDRLRMEQVLTNLIGNAAKYSPKDSTIYVKGVNYNDGMVKISISDEGIGMSPTSLANVFDKFYRDEKAQRNYSGLGLGLYITSRIIKEHGGSIWVESVENVGSTFHFTLPCELSSKPVDYI